MIESVRLLPSAVLLALFSLINPPLSGATRPAAIKARQTQFQQPFVIPTGDWPAGTHPLAGMGINSTSPSDLNHDGTLDLPLARGGPVLSRFATSIPATAATGRTTNAKTVGVASTVLLTVTTPPTLFFGQNVDGTAQVTSGDNSPLTGTVTFFDGSTNICVIPVKQNVSCPAATGSGFLAGRHPLSAVYSGDQTHAAATSTTATVTILPDVTTAILTSSLDSAATSQGVILTAALHGNFAVPTGPVTFFDGTAILGTVTLNSSGSAVLATSGLTPGNHTLSAIYAATQNFNAVTTNSVFQIITGSATAIPTALMISSSANPAVGDQTITLSANVVTTGTGAQIPSGVVTFLDNGIILGTATLNPSGLASFNTSSLAAGAHIIKANYAGDGVSSASSSAAFGQVVTAASGPGNASFLIGVASASVATGGSINVLVKVAPVNGFNQAVQLTCGNLPRAASCIFATNTVVAGGGSTTLKLTTLSPRDCGSSITYDQSASNRTAVLPYGVPFLAGMLVFFLPRRRRAWRGLLTLVAMGGFIAMTGCGACTDLGTRPGTYTIQITGKSMGTTPVTVTQIVQVTVMP